MKRTKIMLMFTVAFYVLFLHILAVSAATNGHTKQEAVNWANAQVGKYLDYDNAYGAQCVDLIKYYYDYLGCADYARGNGKDYATNSLPDGWTRIKRYDGFEPQPGDIAVWTSSTNGHVAIITSGNTENINIVEQNWPSGNECATRTSAISKIWGVIRPDFPADTSSAGDNYLDIGTNFYGLILHKSSWKPISVDDDNYVRLRTENTTAAQVWKFIRQDDNSYVILSAKTGNALEMYAGVTDNGNPAAACGGDWGGNYQRWYILSNKDGYVLKSKHFTDLNKVLDLAYGNTADGTQIQTWEYNKDTTNQVFAIYTGGDICH